MARKTLIQVRRGTAAGWTGADPTLASGEIGFETDTGKFKIGDGTTAWTGLGYAGGGTVASLDDIGDVNVPSPTDQYVLTWDNGTSKWIAATPAGGAPTGAAGGDLSGTYPNPSVVNSSHDHDAATAPGDPHTALRAVDFLVGTATAELSGEIAVGASPGGELGGTWASPTVDATHSGSTHAGAAAAETADIRAVDVLVGTATAAFSGEIVVGTSPGGELGGTWASPTVDATHSGSAHHDAVTLAADADVLLGLSTQQITLDTQTANTVFAGPTSGGAADPTFRAIVSADLPGTTITGLPALTLPTSDDLVLMVDDPSGTPATKKATMAAVTGGAGWTVIRKAVDEDVSSSTTLQDDDELFFTSVNGTVYELEVCVIYSSPVGGGTPDAKFLFAEDATPRGDIRFDNLGVTDASLATVETLATGGNVIQGGTSTAKRVVRGSGWYVGGGGTFKLQWAQNTSDSNATRVHAGSFIRYRVVA